MTRPRLVAHEVLLRVERDGAYADRALDAALSRVDLDPRDRALATELVYGTLRQSIRLDYLLGKLAKQPLRKMPVDTLVALRLGAYQLLETRIPDHSSVSESVALVRRHHPHQAGFANAILRGLCRRRDQGTLPDPTREESDPALALAITSSHPTWLVRRLVAERGLAAAERYVSANNQAAPIWVRVSAREDPVALSERWRALGFTVEPHPTLPRALAVRGAGSPVTWPGFAEGSFTVQDAAAQLVGWVARPLPGSVVVDACAAPGGKTTHLGEQMQDSGTLLALDVHPGRTRLVASAAARMKLRCVQVAAADATDSVLVARLLGQHGATKADLVLLDAPCSGLGTLRRNPELRLRREEDIAALCALQDRLLEAAAAYLSPRGALVYSVCTLTAEEGPERVLGFLTRHPDFRLEAPTDPLLSPYLVPLGAGVALRTSTEEHGMDGFFAVRLVR